MGCGSEQKTIGLDNGVGDFDSYVEKYAKKHDLSIEVARTHCQVKLAEEYYKEEEENAKRRFRETN